MSQTIRASASSYETRESEEIDLLSESQSTNNNFLGNYIIQRLSGYAALQDSRARRCTRKVLEVLAIIIVIGSRAAIVQTCLTGSAVVLNREIKDVGPLLLGIPNAIGSVIAYGCLSVLTKLEIIEILTRYIPQIEQDLMSDNLTPFLRIAIQVAAVFLGFSSQIPLGVGAFEGAFITPGWLNGTFTLLDGGRSSWSMYKTLTSAMQLRREPKITGSAELINARNTLVAQIENFRSLLASENSSIAINEVIDVDYILNKDDKAVQPSPLSLRVKGVVNAFVISLLLAIFAEFYKLGEAGGKKVWENKIFEVVIGSFVVFVNTYLWYDLVSRSTFSIVSLFRKIKSPSLTKKIAPHFYQRFTLGGTIISIPTFISLVYYAKLYFPSPSYELIATGASIAGVMGGIAAMHKLRDMIILRRHSSNPTVVLDNKLKQISETVSKTNLLYIAKFLINLPENIRNKLKAPNQDVLIDYIQQVEQAL